MPFDPLNPGDIRKRTKNILVGLVGGITWMVIALALILSGALQSESARMTTVVLFLCGAGLSLLSICALGILRYTAWVNQRAWQHAKDNPDSILAKLLEK